MRLTKALKKEIRDKAIKSVFKKDIEDLDNRLKKKVKEWMDAPEQQKAIRAYKKWVKEGLSPSYFTLIASCSIYSDPHAYYSQAIYAGTSAVYDQLFSFNRLSCSIPYHRHSSAVIVMDADTPEFKEYKELYDKREKTSALFEGILDSVTTAKRLREVCPELAEFLPTDHTSSGYLVPIDVARKASETLQAAFARNTAG